MEELLQRFNLELIYDHAIYFKDLEDTAYGVLAEDTNWMIRNYGRAGHSDIKIKEIEENIELLKKIVTGEAV